MNNQHKMIDTDDIYHLSGPDGIRSFLVNNVLEQTPSLTITENYSYEYYGPWKLYVNESGNLISSCSCVHWAYKIILPSDGFDHDWGTLESNKSKYLWASVNCLSPDNVTCGYVSISGENYVNFLIGQVDVNGIITQSVNGLLQITGRYL